MYYVEKLNMKENKDVSKYYRCNRMYMKLWEKILFIIVLILLFFGFIKF